MTETSSIFLGIDVGTGGVRAIAVGGSGEVIASVSVAFDPAVLAPQQGRHEQPAEAWWTVACQATTQVTARLKAAGATGQLVALAIDGTSGTVVPVDGKGNPLRPAIMYNDPRAVVQGQRLNAAAGDFCRRLGYQFNASFALAKIAWLQETEPELFDRAVHLVHQADYLVGRLTGVWDVSDYSNALKTGYDLIDERWPVWLDALPDVAARLPRVVAPGTPIGKVSRQAAAETGLPEGLTVVAGATDGTTACLASGVRRPGDYNTTLGTTLVFKGLSDRLCRHPQGLIYCHKLPGGLWLPGAASNTGAEWINRWWPEGYPAEADLAVAGRLPNPVVAYPLVRRGERFPFLCEQAEGFCVPEAAEPLDRHAAFLQGAAFVERMGYEVLDAVAGVAGGEVFSTGGGSRNDLWMQCRADATGRVMHRPACPESAFGAAVLAAGGTIHRGPAEAIARMVRIERTFTPRAAHADAYGRLYLRFRDELSARGYL